MPTVYCAYPKRPLERLTICDVITKAAHSPQLFLDPECWSGLGLEPSTSRTADWLSTNQANQAVIKFFITNK